MRTRSDSPTKTCTKDGCDRPLRARGLCVTHYNQTLPNPRRKVAMTCDSCGETCEKEQRTRRYEGTYCSELCRDFARWGGQTCTLPANHWVHMFGATCEWKAPLPRIECAWCGTTFQPPRTSSRFCKPECQLRFKKAKRRGAQHGAIGTYSWAEIARLWIMFSRTCAYCGTLTLLDDIQAEHVVPLSRGGANNLTNLLPSCGPCNSDKRDLLLPEWAIDRAARGKPPVRTEWADGDPLYAHLTSTLSSALRAA